MRRSSPLSSSLARLGVAVAAAFALAPAIAQTIVIAPSAPPSMRQEVLPRARGGYVWDPGHWQWRNGAYVWLGGHWRPARAGYRWVPGHWVARGPQWRWVEGHWAA